KFSQDVVIQSLDIDRNQIDTVRKVIVHDLRYRTNGHVNHPLDALRSIIPGVLAALSLFSGKRVQRSRCHNVELQRSCSANADPYVETDIPFSVLLNLGTTFSVRL